MTYSTPPRPSSSDIIAAMVELSTLRYFPADDLTKRAVMSQIMRYCDRSDGLSWLVSQLVNRVGQWPGPAEVRGLYCSRFKPADGIEANCSLPGFTAEDGEARNPEPIKLGRSEAKGLLESLK